MLEHRQDSEVEVVGEDVGGDGGREQAGARVAGLEAAPEAGGGDLLVEGGEQVDSGALGGGEVERRDLGLAERKVGPADDDPLGQREQAIGRTPAAESEKAVGTGKDEEGCGGKLAGERGEGIYGVVWGAVGAWSVQGGDGKVGAGCRLLVAGCRLLVAGGSGLQARRAMARRSAKLAMAGAALRGCWPTGAKRTRSSAKASAAAEARPRWPRWMGSNVPPKKATRILSC